MATAATKASRVNAAHDVLYAAGVRWWEENGGVHWVIASTPAGRLADEVDFWPSTGTWIQRDTHLRGKGLGELLDFLGVE